MSGGGGVGHRRGGFGEKFDHYRWVVGCLFLNVFYSSDVDGASF